MTDKREIWRIRPGDPAKTGCAGTADGYNFSIRAAAEETPELLFYKKGQEEAAQILPFPREGRFGGVWSAVVERRDLASYAYCYRIGGERMTDPYAASYVDEAAFGKTAEGVRMARVPAEPAVSPLPTPIPFEDMLIYKVHARGYTKQSKSGVRAKGTFAGLMEKIPYWRDLGVTTLELMPVYEFLEYPEIPKKRQGMAPADPSADPARLNYWGYAAGNYFAPKASFARRGMAERELKRLIGALHEAGLEVLLDFYFPQETDPLLVAEVLRFWRTRYGADGFVLCGDGVWMELLARDPVLADAKLLCPGADMHRLSAMQGGHARRLGEYHMGFQNVMRRFLKGDEEQIDAFLYYNNNNPPTHGAVHYMANHDGFTLADALMYDARHNEQNGEGGRDGNSANYSWNCGAEGPTKKQAVCKLRLRQARNAILLLLLSQGTPLLYGGDEFLNSQAGNNNAYCQDNEIGWTDWKAAARNKDFTDFVRAAAVFRKRHRILHMPFELRATDYRSLGWPEISYHSEKAWFANRDSDARSVGILYCGAYADGESAKAGSFLYVVYNMHGDPHPFALPNLPGGFSWYLAIDSAKPCREAIAPAGCEEKIAEKKSIEAGPRTILVLIGKRDA